MLQNSVKLFRYNTELATPTRSVEVALLVIVGEDVIEGDEGLDEMLKPDEVTELVLELSNVLRLGCVRESADENGLVETAGLDRLLRLPVILWEGGAICMVVDDPLPDRVPVGNACPPLELTDAAAFETVGVAILGVKGDVDILPADASGNTNELACCEARG